MPTSQLLDSLVSAPPMQRADALLRMMTIEEKVMQLTGMYPTTLLAADGPIRSQLDAHLDEGVGHICIIGAFGNKRPETIAKAVNGIQHYLMTETRLGIPAIFHNETLSGVVAPGFTHFPTAIALAATWDPGAVEQMAAVMRRQMRSVGMLQALAPVMDVARDARWGRVHETYGEDPYLVSAMSVAYTRGMQGDDLREGVIATAKHFLGYAVTEAGQNMAATAITARDLHDVYARPFAAAIRLAGLGSVMASYSEYDGVPIHISRAVLTDLLRRRLGFTGTVVSDYAGVAWAHTRQRAAASPEEIAALALDAGLDVELPLAYAYGQVLAKAVHDGLVDEARLDDPVRHVLRDKFALGLFEHPYVDEDPVELRSIASEGVDLSRTLAAESVTLLKNDHHLLPLRRDLSSIAVIGPHADSALVGFPAYTYPAALGMLQAKVAGADTSMAGVDPRDAFMPHEARVALKRELAEVIGVRLEDYVRASYPAVSLADAIRKLLPNVKVTAVAGTGVVPSQPTDLAAAVAAARAADTVILYLGGFAAWSGTNRTEGEGQDSASIDLPPQQVALVEAIAGLGKPIVAIVAMGRPQGLAHIVDHVPALLTAYFAGPHQGEALANAIFGLTNPAGKLPYTLPRHVGQVPIHHGQRTGTGYHRTAADIHKGYIDMPSTPLFSFGHGLSYTTFAYGGLNIEHEHVDTSGELRLMLTIENTGQRTGTEVVQLYAADTATGITLPAQQLVGFARVELEPGEAKTVSFVIPLSLLAYTGRTGELMIEPGPIVLSAGSSSVDRRAMVPVEITGKPRVIRSEDRAFLSTVSVGPALH